MDRIKIPNSFAARLEAQGLSPVGVLRQARLPQTLLCQEKITLCTDQFFSLWRAVGELNRDPAVGLKIGRDPRVERYDPVTTAALSARSFGDALAQLARYKHLVCSEEVHLLEQEDAVSIEFVWPLATGPAPPLLLDAVFSSVIALGRRGTGRALSPERVEFTRKASHRTLYETDFGCPVTFGAPSNALIYSAGALGQGFVTSNPDLLAMLSPSLEAALTQQSAGQTLPDQVKSLQRRLLTAQRSGIQEVAAEMNLSPRTLQRRLRKMGVHYKDLLQNVRCETAQEYLRQSSLGLEEIAFLLGYEETNSFHRAFQDWTGTPPGRWRATRRSEEENPAPTAKQMAI